MRRLLAYAPVLVLVAWAAANALVGCEFSGLWAAGFVAAVALQAVELGRRYHNDHRRLG